MTRWSVTIDDDTDRLVRSHLADAGLSDGALSDFVGRAVKRAVFWETVRAARGHNRDADSSEVEAAVDEAVREARADRA